MNISITLITVCSLLMFTAVAWGGEYPEKWNYMGGNTMTAESTQKLIDALKEAKAAGCTHAMWTGSRGPRIPEMTEEQRGFSKQFEAEAKKVGVKIIPSIFSFGYSGRYFHFDPNLSAGIPVKEMPYIVKGKTAAPDPALALDTSKLTKEGNKLSGSYSVKPFMYYRISFVTTDATYEDTEQITVVMSSGGKRRNCYRNPTITKQNDKFLVQSIFNTLEADKIRVSVDCGKGTVTDVKVEPAGMLLILKRKWLPFKVTSEDGKTEYAEGKDFKEVLDAPLQIKPFPGEFPIDHAAPLIELTDGTSITDGQKLLVSFWHPNRIYNDQDMISMEDPAVWEILELEMKEVSKLFDVEGYMLGYDEIRIAGWEPQPDGKQLKPGQLLAEHFKRAYDLVRKYSPNAKIYTWSDMFTPYHNARPFENKGYYYLVNGNWDGSWEGLPKDVIILNWYSPDAKGTKFFADRGNPQILCGYYDGKSEKDMKNNIAKWMTVSEGVPGILGFMYTTWHSDYSNLDKYFKLVDTYKEWGQKQGAATGPAKDH